MRQFVLTSFRVYHEGRLTNGWSSAVYQPRWYTPLPKAYWMDIRPERTPGSKWIRPREFIDQDRPLDGYFQALRELYSSRADEVKDWIANLPEERIHICCWCPYDKAARRQIEEWGTFVCHTAAVGAFLSDVVGQPVEYDDDRRRMVMP